MSSQVSSLLALSHKLSTAGVVYAVKGATTGNATLATGVWQRHYLANSANTGSAQTSCKESGALLQAALNGIASMSGWVVRMRNDARWEITNTASTWSLTWDGTNPGAGTTNYVIRNLFGYSGNIPSTAAGTYVAADYNPWGVIACIGRSDAAGWVPEAPLMATARLDDGSTYGWTSAVVPYSRSFDLLFHPYSKTERADRSDPHTPTHGDPDYWQTTQGQGLTANRTHPFSVLEGLQLANGREWGLALSPLGFNAHIAGTTTSYDRAHLDFTTLKAALVALQGGNWSAVRSIKGLRFWRVAQATRS